MTVSKLLDTFRPTLSFGMFTTLHLSILLQLRISGGEEDMALGRKSPVAFLRERVRGFIDPKVKSHQSSMTTMGDGD